MVLLWQCPGSCVSLQVQQLWVVLGPHIHPMLTTLLLAVLVQAVGSDCLLLSGTEPAYMASLVTLGGGTAAT
jgi:uncharacterized membrane protein